MDQQRRTKKRRRTTYLLEFPAIFTFFIREMSVHRRVTVVEHGRSNFISELPVHQLSFSHQTQTAVHRDPRSETHRYRVV